MKKTLFGLGIVFAVIVLFAGSAYAAENGIQAKIDDRNPAFEQRGGMGDMGGMVVNVNNESLHFSVSHGHIRIPGRAGDNTSAPVFEQMQMEDMVHTHLSPPGRVKQFHHE